MVTVRTDGSGGNRTDMQVSRRSRQSYNGITPDTKELQIRDVGLDSQ